MFLGLSAFPLTPMDEQGLDERAFIRLVEHLAEAGVDSIGALGSTGSYAYLNPEERARVAHLAVEGVAGRVPVIVGIGALRTRDVLSHADNAQQAATALNAGCDAWYSVLGGLFPKTALAITRAAQAGDTDSAQAASQALEPLWALYRDYGGSLRVIATMAEIMGKVSHPCLPLPLKTLQGDGRKRVEQVLEKLDLN